ncbi:MAG: PIG-L family deacetylase [Acidobacteria bacterium]|nr:PIG-L family deacetylase [Acidobacteriota bacterium]
MSLRLLAVFAHPDDESFGVGATLARYAAEGVELSLLTATRGDGGRFRGLAPGDPKHPGPDELARIREAELAAAASVLGIGHVVLLDYHDRQLDRVDPREMVTCIAGHLRRVRPHVVLTFGPDGVYGHPDHIAMAQFTAAAAVAAADPAFVFEAGQAPAAPHAVAKLYYTAWPESTWRAHETAFKRWTSTVDGVERHAMPWPDWAITTVIDARPFWPTALRAVACHESQFAAYARLQELPAGLHEALWGWQHYYRVFSTVNGGREKEHDLFAGLRTEGRG